MKWALLFLLLNPAADQPISRTEIIKTFVDRPACLKVMHEKQARVEEISREDGPASVPGVFLSCVPYTGPWKKEVRVDG